MSRNFYNQVLSFGINPVIMIFFHMKKNHSSSGPLSTSQLMKHLTSIWKVLDFICLSPPLGSPAGVWWRPLSQLAGVMSPSSCVSHVPAIFRCLAGPILLGQC